MLHGADKQTATKRLSASRAGCVVAYREHYLARKEEEASKSLIYESKITGALFLCLKNALVHVSDNISQAETDHQAPSPSVLAGF